MITVLVVEDAPVSGEAIGSYVERVPGFVVGDRARTGSEALHLLTRNPYDLVLLDIHLPDMPGLDLLREMRGQGCATDVIVATKAGDADVLHTAVSYGAIHYLIRPFGYAALRDRLGSYRAYRSQLSAVGPVPTQSAVDRVLARLWRGRALGLPKGLGRESLHAVAVALRDAGGTGLSAGEAAARVGASRVTVRRYLEYLAETGMASRLPRYGGAHRPAFVYRWREPGEEKRPDAT